MDLYRKAVIHVADFEIGFNGFGSNLGGTWASQGILTWHRPQGVAPVP